MSRKCFVFGSNESGIHGAGAAFYAMKHLGAQYGVGNGPTGKCYALPTKDFHIRTLPLETVQKYVDEFKAYAHTHPQKEFQVTRVGCGLAGYTDDLIAPLFIGCPSNCHFDDAWKEYLGESYKYWGTF